MSPFLHWSRYSIPFKESACRWPMKLDGITEMKRRSVMIPVSMLLNSRRVWAPVMWPKAQNTQLNLQIPFNISTFCEHSSLIPPIPSTVTLSTESCKFFPRRTTFTVCHSLSFSFSPTRSISGPLPKRRKASSDNHATSAQYTLSTWSFQHEKHSLPRVHSFTYRITHTCTQPPFTCNQ